MRHDTVVVIPPGRVGGRTTGNPQPCGNVVASNCHHRAAGHKTAAHLILLKNSGKNMSKLERKLTTLATERGLTVSDADIFSAAAHLVRFLRAATTLQKSHDENRRNFSPDLIRETRQRILAASADFTPIRLCRAAANDRIA